MALGGNEGMGNIEVVGRKSGSYWNEISSFRSFLASSSGLLATRLAGSTTYIMVKISSFLVLIAIVIVGAQIGHHGITNQNHVLSHLFIYFIKNAFIPGYSQEQVSTTHDHNNPWANYYQPKQSLRPRNEILNRQSILNNPEVSYVILCNWWNMRMFLIPFLPNCASSLPWCFLQSNLTNSSKYKSIGEWKGNVYNSLLGVQISGEQNLTFRPKNSK